jgi:hypothetical protein
MGARWRGVGPLGKRGFAAATLHPLPAQALPLLRGKLPQPLPLLAHPLPLLGRQISELPELLLEGTPFLGWHRLPSLKPLTKLSPLLFRKVPPPPVVFSNPILLLRWKLSELL